MLYQWWQKHLVHGFYSQDVLLFKTDKSGVHDMIGSKCEWPAVKCLGIKSTQFGGVDKSVSSKLSKKDNNEGQNFHLPVVSVRSGICQAQAWGQPRWIGRMPRVSKFLLEYCSADASLVKLKLGGTQKNWTFQQLAVVAFELCLEDSFN